MADETLTRREDTRQKLEKSTTCSGNTKDTQSFADLTDASRKTARGKTRAFLFCIVRRGHGVTKERKAAEKARRPRPSAPDRARGYGGSSREDRRGPTSLMFPIACERPTEPASNRRGNRRGSMFSKSYEGGTRTDEAPARPVMTGSRYLRGRAFGIRSTAARRERS